MNAVKFGRFACGPFKRNVNAALEKNARCYGSSKKLVNVDVNSETGIYTVRLNRQPVNSLNLELLNEFTSAMMTVEKEKGKGMIVTSTSPGVFSAGLDLMELYKPNPDRLRAYWSAIQDMWLNLFGSGFNTVAAVTGHAPGGGCLIAISCDYRVMVKGKFGMGLNESQVGLAVPSWCIDTYKNILPPRICEMALLSGKLFNPDEALNAGLVDEVADNEEDAISKAEKYLSTLAKLSRRAVGRTKMTVRYDAIRRLQDDRENDARVFLNFINSPDTQNLIDKYVQNLKKKK